MKTRILSLLGVLALSVPALAQTHELSGATNGNFRFAKGSLWFFDATTNYDYTLTNEIQVGARAYFLKPKGSEFVFGLAPGITYNIGAIPEAIFVGAHLGYAKGGYWSFDVEAGKRFEIAPGVSWKPYVSYALAFKPSPSTWALRIVPVSLSVHW